MPGAKTWTEKINSQELQNLFGDFDVEIPDNSSRLSFAKGFLEASKLTEFVAEIRTFANRVVLWKRLKDKYKKPGTVYVHKVVVETIGNEIVIKEKVTSTNLFLNLVFRYKILNINYMHLKSLLKMIHLKRKNKNKTH